MEQAVLLEPVFSSNTASFVRRAQSSVALPGQGATGGSTLEGPTMECDPRTVVARTGSSQLRGAGSPWTPSIGEVLLHQVLVHHQLLPPPLLRPPPRIAAAVTAALVAAALAAVAVAATAGTAVPETATPAASGTATTAESVRSAAAILLLPWHEQHLQPHPLPQ